MIVLFSLICLAASLTNVKLLSVQPVEIVLFLTALTWFAVVVNRGFRLRIVRSCRPFLGHYLLWILFVGALSAWAFFTVRFFVPFAVDSFLKQPPWISVARILQCGLVGFGFFFCTGAFSRDGRTLLRAVDAYVVVGCANALYGTVSWLLLLGGWNLGGAYDAGEILRARGVFVEGGPFGLYLASVIAVILFKRYELRASRTLTFLASLGIVSTGFVLSFSKAGVLAFLALIACPIVFQKGQATRRLALSFLFLAVVAFFAKSFVFEQLYAYAMDFASIESRVSERSDDQSLVMGRLAAAVIVPNMVSERPLSGVGFGNYSLTRNDPRFRAFLPEIRGWDLTGLGLLGMAAELGIPLTLYLLYLVSKPLLWARREVPTTKSFVALLAFQPIALLLGVQVTFFYTWIVASFALSHAIRKEHLLGTGYVMARPSA